MAPQTLYHVWVPLYLSWRVLLANRLSISDCDETYNFWEPLHFLLYGSGMQVWEYAHEYALRTYGYLLPLKYLAQCYQALLQQTVTREWVLLPLLQQLIPETTSTRVNSTLPDKLALFILLRSTIGLITGCVEVYWLTTLYRHTKLSGRLVLWTALLLLTNVGMSHSAAALLPSATWNTLSLLASALATQRRYMSFCVVAIAATLGTGWPFGAVLLVPWGVRVLIESCVTYQATLRMLLWIVGVTLVLQAAVMLVDHKYYGRWTSPTLNVFLYNAAGGGDALYGVEPASYYVKNLLVNCNIVAVLGAPAIVLSYFTQRRDWDVWTTLLSMWLWIGITFTRPHKEERFLFPLYPLLCLGAAMTVDAACNAVGRLVGAFSRHKELSSSTRFACHAMVWIPAVLISLMRIAALAQYYTAPLHVYTALASYENVMVESTLVCTCGEWYRYPSSFFLPAHAQLGFLPSSFRGQLPQAFTEHGSLPQSSKVLQPFNDRNQDEPSRYVSLDQCDYIVDQQGSDCIPADSTIIAQAPFLDTGRTVTLHRVLYIPIWHEVAVNRGQVHYNEYVLARTRK